MKTEPIYQAQRGVTHTCLCILSCCIIGAVHSFVEFIHTTTNLNDIIVIRIYITYLSYISLDHAVEWGRFSQSLQNGRLDFDGYW